MHSCEKFHLDAKMCKLCYNFSFGLTIKARACKGAGQKWALESHFMLLGMWECGRVWGNEPSHFQVSSHFGSWSPDGLPYFQIAIVGVKTHWIEEFFISLEKSWNLVVQNGLAWPIWVIKTQVMAQKNVENQIANLTPNH